MWTRFHGTLPALSSVLDAPGKLAAVILFCTLMQAIAPAAEPQSQPPRAEGKITHLNTTVRTTAAQPMPTAATLDLGSVNPGTLRQFNVTIRNETSEPLKFDNLSAGGDIRSQFQVSEIAPHGSVDVQLSLQVKERPLAIIGSGRGYFRLGDRPVILVDYSYSVADYLGLSVNQVVVTAATTHRPQTPIEFSLPIVADARMNPARVGLILDGIEGEFEFTAKPAQSVVQCRLTTADDKFQRLYGTLQLVDLEQGRTARIPLMIERENELKLLPAVARFIRDESDETYVAHFYLRSPKSDSSPSFCVVTTKFGTATLKSSYENRSAGLGKISIRLTLDQLEAQSDKQSSHTRPDHMTVDIALGKHQLSQSIAYTLSVIR